MVVCADGGDQVCQQAPGLAESERDERAPVEVVPPFDAAAVTARNAWASIARVMWRYQAS
jgi:hypothetical protein